MVRRLWAWSEFCSRSAWISFHVTWRVFSVGLWIPVLASRFSVRFSVTVLWIFLRHFLAAWSFVVDYGLVFLSIFDFVTCILPAKVRVRLRRWTQSWREAGGYRCAENVCQFTSWRCHVSHRMQHRWSTRYKCCALNWPPPTKKWKLFSLWLSTGHRPIIPLGA